MNMVNGQLITVLQGECHVTREPDITLTTILGSCVAVCLFDPQATVGGMNHFLLPGSGAAEAQDSRYGVYLLELLINGLLRQGAARDGLKAKVFGGAQMSQHFRRIGQENGEFAIEFLEREGIPVLAQDLGGTQARRIRFVPTTGRAMLNVVENSVEVIDQIRPGPAVVAQKRPDIILF